MEAVDDLPCAAIDRPVVKGFIEKAVEDGFAVDDAVYAELGLGAKDIDSIYRTALQRYLFGGDNTKRAIPTPDGTKQA